MGAQQRKAREKAPQALHQLRSTAFIERRQKKVSGAFFSPMMIVCSTDRVEETRPIYIPVSGLSRGFQGNMISLCGGRCVRLRHYE